METDIAAPSYSGKLRVRVCGICQQDNQLLLVRHKPFGQNKEGLWSPPGGGVNYGESLQLGLIREIAEETNLKVEVEKFLFVHEFIGLPLHALEIFFKVNVIGGTLITGYDPEFTPDNQLITKVVFKSLTDIRQIPQNQLHHCLHHLQNLEDLYNKEFFSSIL
ncbi:NUDIX hydrolase [Adhaeribacter swui]|uniref:NUDIX hydrolase n=1 Tax=Adhaeribacter swui TaxID=2086471 RepID=A0A7G7GBL9_9BACT|nr:NUDIX hydrolase [Adhaeribacter swui]QNF34553.1 NUDIX hydrolase [Adhaeribacter swui]